MRCSNCGQDISFSAKVCPWCKTATEKDQVLQMSAIAAGLFGGFLGYCFAGFVGAIVGGLAAMIVTIGAVMAYQNAVKVREQEQEREEPRPRKRRRRRVRD